MGDFFSLLRQFLELNTVAVPLGVLDAGLNIAAFFQKTKEKFKDNSIEYEIICTLEDSLKKLCEDMGWEYDALAVSQEIDHDTLLTSQMMTREGLGKLFSKLIGFDFDDTTLDVVIDCFDKSVADNEKLHRYLDQKWKRSINTGLPSFSNKENWGIGSKKAELPVSTNRFKYNSNSTSLIGRDDEISFLTEMCDSSQLFYWIGICGAGGTGKSKLAYELCARMIKNDWFVFPPMHFNKHIYSDIQKKISAQQGNILVCLDYIKQEKDNIAILIQYIADNLYKYTYKIRLILIEREENDVQMDEDNDDLNEYRYSGEYNGRVFNGIINLSPLSEDSIRDIVYDYILKQDSHAEVLDDSLDLIIETLGSVDHEYRRPVYALFIADAWINGEKLIKWDRDDALQYLLTKEKKRLKQIIEDPQNQLGKVEQQKYKETINHLYALATYMGTICISDYCDVLDKHKVSENDEMLNRLMKEFGILDSENNVEGWAPDSIGEFFCIDYYNSCYKNNSIEAVKEFVNLVLDRNIRSYIRYTGQIFDDYPDILINCPWTEALRNIEFPARYRSVYKDQFMKQRFLKNIIFTGRVNSIQAGAFRDCENLERIIYPSSLEFIEQYAFSGCKSLVEVLPEEGNVKYPSIIRIDRCAFLNCVSLQRIILPESIQEIGTSAFKNCSLITEINLPHKIRTINISLFAGCNSLRRVRFESDKSIILNARCFCGCQQLSEIKGVEKITAIGPFAFNDCRNLRSFTFSSKLKTLSDNAFEGCRSLKQVDLSECEIDSIPEMLFSNCTSLAEVSLPNGIMRINNRSFYGCESIERFNFNPGLETIGLRAFGECKKLKCLKLPKSLQTIESYAFENCTCLSEITFKTNPKAIEDHVFAGCTNLSFSKIRGLQNDRIIEFCGFTFTSFSASDYSFVQTYLTKENVEIPSTVSAIGKNVFQGHRYKNGYSTNKILKSVVIPPSVKTIGENAFKGCINLRSILCENSSLEFIGQSAFSGCISLKGIEGPLPVNMICDNTFRNCQELETISISRQLERIGNYAFFNCYNLESINISSQCIPRYVGVDAFKNCNKLKPPIDLNMINEMQCKPDNIVLGGFVFKKITRKEIEFVQGYSELETIDIPDTCVDISGVVFRAIKRMKKVIIPDTIQELPDRVFSECLLLETVELPVELTSIPSNAFKNCKSLKTVNFRGYKSNFIPDGVDIGEGAFAGCCEISSMTLPDSLTRIKKHTFRDCRSLKTINIPANINAIGNRAFSNCTGLEFVKLSEGLTSIGKNAFCGCSALIKVENLENTALTIVENNTFDSCYRLDSLTLPQSLEAIKGHAFENCHNLKISRDFLPSGVNEIGDAAFQSCYSIEFIRLPSNLKEIRDYTFKQCSSLREVGIPDDVTYIGQSAFYHCNSLEEIKMPSELKTIGISAFANCYSLKTIKVPDKTKKLPADLFKGCISLEKVDLPEFIRVISANCFKDCVSLNKINLNNNLRLINVGAFRNCNSLKMEMFKMPDGLKEVRESAFRYCDGIERVVLPHNLKRITPDVFAGCSNLKEVIFNHTISSVGNSAFMDCVSLERFPFQLIGQRIGKTAFRNCISLPDPDFSDTIEQIDYEAFQGCTNIENLVLPRSLRVLHKAAFKGNSNLREVTIPEQITVIMESTFRDCPILSKVSIQSSELFIHTTAFKGCVKLSYIKLPLNTFVQSDAFEDCPVENDIKKNASIHLINMREESDFLIAEDKSTGNIILLRYVGPNVNKVVVKKNMNTKLVIGNVNSCFEKSYGIEKLVLPESMETIDINSLAERL